jgi:histidinol dehydrogenase
MIPVFELSQIPPCERSRIVLRAQADIDCVKEKVTDIIAAVRREGDAALLRFTRQWDDPDHNANRLRVASEDIEEAYRKTDPETIRLIRDQIALSKKFHDIQRKQIRNWEVELEDGITVGERWTAIDEVGLYVPGGKNPFPTVQQILAVAARSAGCSRIVSCISPRGTGYEVLVAATECGVSEIYRVGGAQAIAAMAYGTETIRPVSLIAGPGSPFVTAAKILCQSKVAIDMPAGPSEAIILADASLSDGIDLASKARLCAADILARAEHGPDSAAVLLTDSAELADLTRREVERQFETLSRQGYIRDALSNYCAIIVTASMAEAIDFTNEYAPEHLEIITADPCSTLNRIRNAGSAFLGFYNPVAVGDYATGINHVLPSSGWARQTSPAGVWTFMKRIQFSSLSSQGLNRLKPIVQCIADVEGLDAHKRSVEIRFEKEPLCVR